MKIAITGASGHIGNNICRLLVNSGHEITVMVHKNVDGLEQLPVKIVHSDILNREEVADFINGMDIVIHLAAIITMYKKDALAKKINIEGTKNIIEACLTTSIKRLIYFSSIDAVNQLPLNIPIDESKPLDLESTYAYNYSKAMGEKLVLEACKNGLNAVVLSPTAVLGPHDYMPSLAGSALIRFYQGRNPSIIPGGYNWVDVRDVAMAAISSIDKGKTGHKYLLSGHWKSVLDLTEMVELHGGAKAPTFKSPFWLAYLGVPFIRMIAAMKNELPLYTSFTLETIQYSNKQIVNAKAVKDLGFEPRNFEDTVSDTLRWFKSQNMLS